jgi:hypothetical protein
MDGTLVVVSGTEVLFTQKGPRIIFIREQFWGRAARASGDSRESGRPFNFWGADLRRCPFFASFTKSGEY